MKKLFPFLFLVSFLVVSCGPTTDELATLVANSISETADSWTQTPSQTHTPTMTLTSIATQLPPPPFTIGDCVFEEDCPEANQITSYLDADLEGNVLTNVVFPFDDLVRLNNAWCTKDETILAENEEHITYIFEIDGVSYLDYATIRFGYWWGDDPDDAIPCMFVGATLSDFQIGQEHQISVGYSFDTEVNDGWDSYAPFTYVHLYNLVPVSIPTPTSTPMNDFSAYLTGSGVNLFHGPGTGYDIDYYITSDDTLNIVGSAYDCTWIKVKTSDSSKTGWVYYTYLEYDLECSDIPSASIPPMPTAPYYTPTPSCERNANIEISNTTGGLVTLHLNGPASFTFYLSSGDTTLSVCSGTYSYTAYGCGGAQDSGTMSSGDSHEFYCQ